MCVYLRFRSCFVSATSLSLSLSLSHDSVSGFTEFATRAAAMVAANIRDERVFARLKEHKGT
jgi:hypothetical protein